MNLSSYNTPIKTFGNSMLPLLQDGDVVFPQKIKFEKIKVNDIISVRRYPLTRVSLPRGERENREGVNPSFIILSHRVIYRTPKYLITKGDNNKSSDGKIYSKDVLGVVNKVKRNASAQGSGESKGRILNINDIYLMQSTLYFNEIVKVKKTFISKKIDHIILKGLPLHLFYEGKIPERIYADCDILVPRRRIRRVRKLLEGLGYIELDSSFSEFQKSLKNQDTEITFYKNINGIPVYFDIHIEVGFMMVQIGKLDALYSQKLLDELMLKFVREVRQVRIVGENLPILSPENLFIYLILHLYHHNFTGPYRYDLIVNILKREKLDFKNISTTVNKFKLNNYIYLGILLLQKYYFVEFKKDFLNNIQPSTRILKIINNQSSIINIFSEKTRFSNGVDKFKLLFDLSPRRSRRYFVFLNPQIIYFITMVVLLKFKMLILNYNGKKNRLPKAPSKRREN